FEYILGTDYETHSTVYTCTQDGELRDQLAWILSPTPEMDPAILEAALGIFEANGVDTSLFLPATVQGGDCVYPPEGTPPPPRN
ncbi:hypothetical protein GUF81_11335, partial [Xanthomonas citri pv. citri]|nr:hypothetical protein [Xanthomonas citri pv. citri]